MVLRLGYAHAMAVRLPPQAHLGFASKSYIHVWGTSLAVLGLFTYALRGLREPNIYHGRGIRLSRQVLVRKHGKVSAYR
jgi:ribosomal protein L6P/L9E